MDNTHIYFLRDFSEIIYERAIQARDEYRQLKASGASTGEISLAEGIAFGYYVAISTFIHQAQTFDIYQDLGILAQIDPDELNP